MNQTRPRPPNPAIRGPALLSVAFFALLILALSQAHQGNLSALMMLPQKGACYEALSAPRGVVVFPEAGYDGHFFYYIARDLKMKVGCAGAYRCQRIFYPVLIWLFALGRAELMPLAMSLINLLAVGGATWLMARWLTEEGFNPWFGLFYSLSLGHVLIIQYALSGAVAAALSLGGAYLFVRAERSAGTAFLFSLALLTRETAVLLWAPLILWALKEREYRRAAVLALALIPYLAWEAILWGRFGELPLLATNVRAVTLDLEGLRWLAGHLELDSGWRELLRSASSLPYLIFVLACLTLGAWHLAKGLGLWAWLTFIQAAAVLFLGRGMWEYISSVGRVSITLTPAAVMLALEAGGRTRLILLGGLGLLFGLGLWRIHLAGVHPFFVQP